VKPLVWLPIEKAIPINQDFVWNNLSFTKNLDRNNPKEKTTGRLWYSQAQEHGQKQIVIFRKIASRTIAKNG